MAQHRTTHAARTSKWALLLLTLLAGCIAQHRARSNLNASNAGLEDATNDACLNAKTEEITCVYGDEVVSSIGCRSENFLRCISCDSLFRAKGRECPESDPSDASCRTSVRLAKEDFHRLCSHKRGKLGCANLEEVSIRCQPGEAITALGCRGNHQVRCTSCEALRLEAAKSCTTLGLSQTAMLICRTETRIARADVAAKCR